eukprot:m.279389 g.279389  ORF g.279389 m.279389 type:complete len:667 (+) comp40623_c0_seq3:1198-3198(+)
MLFRRSSICPSQKVAVNEGLYYLFREIVPKDPAEVGKGVEIGNSHVFEHSALCWAYLLSKAKHEDGNTESFTEISITCPLSYIRIEDPVRVPGVEKIYDRSSVLSLIQDGKSIAGCSVSPLVEDALERVPDFQRLLLCFPQSTNEVFLWTGASQVASSLTAPAVPSTACSWADLLQKRKSQKCLCLVPPLKLKVAAVDGSLTLDEQGHMAVFSGLAKDVQKPVILFSPLSGQTTQWNPDQLAVSVSRFANRFETVGANSTTSKSVITRLPKEAIVVLLDVSSSMNEKCFDGSMSRISAVKQLFHAFANRSMAYNYPHVIGLTLFGSTVSVVSEVSELFESFKENVDVVVASGRTKLYDAVVNAACQLEEFTKSYPNCRKRILCLTDGEDISSSSTPLETVQKVQTLTIPVDAVLVGAGNLTLKSISVASGGCCFLPKDFSQGLKLFEMETVLSLAERVPSQLRSVGSESALKQYESVSNFPYHTEPRHRTPDEISRPVVSAKRALHQASVSLPQGGVVSAPARLRRILKEMGSYQRNPHPSVEIYPCEDRLDFWRMLLVGPDDTPYARGVFILYTKFPNDYPQSAPEMRFITPIYHCNINSNGRICHSVFERNYTTDTSVRTIIDCLYGLLLEPEPDDPLDSTLAEEYFCRRCKYDLHSKDGKMCW